MRMKESLMNIERASDPDKKRKFVKEDVLTKVPAKPDVAEQGTKKRKGGHMKMLARKRKRPQPDVDKPMGTSGYSTISWRYFISLIGKIYSTCRLVEEASTPKSSLEGIELIPLGI
ncbi:hypothetical protein Tco_1032136 [Tanacetum coccineum]|uniref:Uncharacterized protein n=1 Tax=Tanacetum coccineum TaxID=301880 RepID=A0ABQ5GBI3_9ASTR